MEFTRLEKLPKRHDYGGLGEFRYGRLSPANVHDLFPLSRAFAEYVNKLPKDSNILVLDKTGRFGSRTTQPGERKGKNISFINVGQENVGIVKEQIAKWIEERIKKGGIDPKGPVYIFDEMLMTGGSVKEVQKAVKELQKEGVLSETEPRIITFCNNAHDSYLPSREVEEIPMKLYTAEEDDRLYKKHILHGARALASFGAFGLIDAGPDLLISTGRSKKRKPLRDAFNRVFSDLKHAGRISKESWQALVEEGEKIDEEDW